MKKPGPRPGSVRSPFRRNCGPSFDAARLVIESGCSFGDAAKQFGVSRQAVHHALRQLRTPAPESVYEQVLRLAVTGMRGADISRALDISQGCVSYHLRAARERASRKAQP